MLTRYIRNITLVLLLTFGMGNVHAQETQLDIDFLKEVQATLTKGVVHDAIKMMKDSVGINIYPAFHIADDSALWPYALELYFDVRIERKEPYVLVKLNLNPSTGKWTDFSSYSVSVSLTQGQQKAVPTTVLVAAEKQLNEILANIGNLREYFGQVRDNIAETIQKLRFAMMDKYWEGRKLPLVTFYPAPGSLYGFDPPVKEALISKYQNFYRYDTIIRAPWKALSITKPDKVQAYIQVRDTAFKTSQVRFVNRGNTLLQPLQTNNDTLVFMLTGTSGGNVDEITAEYFATDATGKERKAPIGQVKTVSYEEKTDILYIVPVNGAAYPGTKNDLEKYLNAVYGQAVTNWEVKFAAGIKVTGWDLDRNDTLNIQTSMFQRYSDEEQAFIEVMEKQAGYDPKAVYLFVTNIPNSLERDNRTRVLGYMPLNAQYGFLFTSKNALGSNAEKEIYNRTTAHELGHGIYRLSHTWEEYAMMPGSSENLMDYNNGSALWKPQWDWIHDPGMRLYMFQKAEEGAGIFGINTNLVIKVIENIRCAYVKNKFFSLKELGFYSAWGCVDMYDENSYCDLSINSRHKNWNPSPINRKPSNGIFYVSSEGTGIPYSTTKEDLVVRVNNEQQDKFYEYLYPTQKNWQDQLLKHKWAIDKAPDHSKFIDLLNTFPEDAFGSDLELYFRKSFLKRLTEGNVNESWFGSIDREGLVIQLLNATPTDQRPHILSYLKEGNNNLLKKYWDKLDGQSLDAFINTITLWVSQSVSEPPWSVYDYPSYWQTNKTRITKLFHIWKIHERNDLFNKQIFGCSSYFITGGTKISFKTYFKNDKNSKESADIECYNEIDAFDWVAVEFMESFPKLQIKEGDRFVVPIIWVKWLSRRINLDDNLSDLRIVGDIVATLTPLKFAGLAKMAPEIAQFAKNIARVLPLIDIVRTSSENVILNKFGDEGKAVLDKWDRLYSYYALGEITVVSYNLSKSFIQGSIDLYTKVKDINTYTKIAGNSSEALSFRNKFLNLYESIKHALNGTKGIWASKGFTKVDDWIKGITNVSNRANIENILKNWNDDLLRILNSRLTTYPKLGTELTEKTALLNAFEKLETTWAAKFGLRKLSFKGELPQEFSKMIDDIKIMYNKKTYRLGDILVDEIENAKLGDLGSAPLGNIFDAEMESIISKGWINGTYSGLSDEIITRLTSLKSQGYELIVKPQVSIGVKNPIPDFLFVKKDGANFILDDCIYIDNKYFHDVPFTGPQEQIVRPFRNGATETTVIAKGDIFDLNGNIIINNGSILKIKKIEIFTVKENFSLGKINKP